MSYNFPYKLNCNFVYVCVCVLVDEYRSNILCLISSVNPEVGLGKSRTTSVGVDDTHKQEFQSTRRTEEIS